MSTIEERLMRDITAVTGGVVVTDSDLKEARRELTDRIESQHRRSRFRVVAAVAAAAAVAAVGGVIAVQTLEDDDGRANPANTPSAPAVNSEDADWLIGDPPSSALLVGMWRVDDGLVSLRFDSDGTVEFSDRGKLFGDPSTTGTYEADGYQITVTTTEDDDPECVGRQFTLRASMFELGLLRYAFSDATDCAPLPLGRQDLEQVVPTSERMMFENVKGWGPLPASTDLYGDFIAEGGGYVLELNRDGTYYVAGGAGRAVDRGSWTRQDRELTLTSSSRATGCQQRDELVLSGLESTTEPGTLVFRGTVEQNPCAGGWTPTGWVRIPNAAS
jgi:hypothetical protein